jgi:hypothetical protein
MLSISASWGTSPRWSFVRFIPFLIIHGSKTFRPVLAVSYLISSLFQRQERLLRPVKISHRYSSWMIQALQMTNARRNLYMPSVCNKVWKTSSRKPTMIEWKCSNCWVIQAIKHAQIYTVRQLAYSTELLVCINQA